MVSPRRASSASARPRKLDTAATSPATPPPSRARRRSSASSSAACRSSSAPRATMYPTALRSSACTSVRGTRIAGTPARGERRGGRLHGGCARRTAECIVALDEQDARDGHGGERRDERVQLSLARRHHRQGGGRRDHEIAGVERVERGDPGTQHPDPRDLPRGRGSPGELRRPRQELRGQRREVGQSPARHAGAGRLRRRSRRRSAACRDQRIDQAPELAIEVHLAIRAAHEVEPSIRTQPRPDPATRQVERDRQPDQQRREGRPDDDLAGVPLGDQQRVFAEAAQRAPSGRGRPCRPARRGRRRRDSP